MTRRREACPYLEEPGSPSALVQNTTIHKPYSAPIGGMCSHLLKALKQLFVFPAPLFISQAAAAGEVFQGFV